MNSPLMSCGKRWFPMKFRSTSPASPYIHARSGGSRRQRRGFCSKLRFVTGFGVLQDVSLERQYALTAKLLSDSRVATGSMSPDNNYALTQPVSFHM